MDPQVPCHTRIKSGLILVLNADLQYHILVVLLNVVVEQLLFEAQQVTAGLDAVTNLEDLEEEQHVILVNFQMVSRDERNYFVLGLPEVIVDLLLLRIKHVLQQSVVQVDLGQIGLLQLFGESLSKILDDVSQKLLGQVEVVNENL